MATGRRESSQPNPYRDEQGAHLYDVVRFEPKDLRQRRADGAWKMAGVRRVLYRLNELQGKAIAYVVEGEKDADRLHALGLPGTTNPGGASKNPDRSKWREEYSQQLQAAGVESVVVFPDNDDPGRAHADAVARSCYAAGLAVKVVKLLETCQCSRVGFHGRTHIPRRGTERVEMFMADVRHCSDNTPCSVPLICAVLDDSASAQTSQGPM
jgi:hypothetical protein